MKLKPEEVSQWLDSPVTERFLEGIALRMKLVEDSYATGHLYIPGNPFMSAEQTAANFARVNELKNIVEEPTLYLERPEDEDE